MCRAIFRRKWVGGSREEYLLLVGSFGDFAWVVPGEGLERNLAEACSAATNLMTDGYYPVYVDSPRGHAGYCAWHSAGTCPNGVTVQFSLASASNAVPYNFYKASSLTQQFWTYLGPVFASNTYAFSNQPLAGSWYRLSGPPVTMAVAWGDDLFGEADVPFGLTNVIGLAGGYEHSLALQSQGTVTSWGYPGSWPNWVPTDLPRSTPSDEVLPPLASTVPSGSAVRFS